MKATEPYTTLMKAFRTYTEDVFRAGGACPEADRKMNELLTRAGGDLFLESNAMGVCLRIGTRHLKGLTYWGDYRNYAYEVFTRVPFSPEFMQCASYVEAAQEDGTVVVIKHRTEIGAVQLPHSTLG